jgi:hypothetical protein
VALDARVKARPVTGAAPDCGAQNHLWTIALKPGEKVVCRRCGKVRRGRRVL